MKPAALLLPLLLAATPLALATGCDATSRPAPPPTTDAADAAPLPRLTPSAEGTRYDPALDAEQLPQGAFICDMGTIHYARSERGDGRCPICGMMLTEHKHGWIPTPTTP